MKTALVVTEFPYGQDKGEEQKTFRNWLDAADKRATQSKGIEKLDQNVWLIDVENGLHFLAWLLASAEHHKIKTKIALLEEAPKRVVSLRSLRSLPHLLDQVLNRVASDYLADML